MGHSTWSLNRFHLKMLYSVFVEYQPNRQGRGYWTFDHPVGIAWKGFCNGASLRTSSGSSTTSDRLCPFIDIISRQHRTWIIGLETTRSALDSFDGTGPSLWPSMRDWCHHCNQNRWSFSLDISGPTQLGKFKTSSYYSRCSLRFVATFLSRQQDQIWNPWVKEKLLLFGVFFVVMVPWYFDLNLTVNLETLNLCPPESFPH